MRERPYLSTVVEAIEEGKTGFDVQVLRFSAARVGPAFDLKKKKFQICSRLSTQGFLGIVVLEIQIQTERR